MGEGPKDGERVLFCGHAHVDPELISLKGPVYYYRAPAGPEEVTAPDGRKFVAEWFVFCWACRAAVKKGVDPGKLIKKDAEWIGEPPAFERIQ